MTEAHDRHYNCTQCGARTTKQLSLGMLGCRYHPHIDGAMKPTPNSLQSVQFVDTSSAGNCNVCCASYFNHESYLLDASKTGCTAVDHLSAQDGALPRFLMQHPYEVMPLSLFMRSDLYSCARTAAICSRLRTAYVGGAQALVFSRMSELYADGASATKPAYLHIQLHQPRASECGVPTVAVQKAFDCGLRLSLEALYNECAMKFNYAPLKESPWMRKVLFANRHTLASGDKDTGGGIVTMTKEQVLERELYSTAHDMEEFDDFVPFAVIMRVEARSVRIVAEK